MFALDLFNTDHERRLAEGAVDQLEQRRIDDLAMKMDDLVARARKATTPEAKAALIKEFQKCKDERDSYFKIKDECMGYGSLGEADQVLAPAQPVRPGTDLVTPQQRVAGATPPSNTALGKAKSTFASFANWLAGKDDTGPTYESAVKEQAGTISPVNSAKYAYEQMRKAHDDNVDIATIRWMGNQEPITMSRNQLYHTLTKLKTMSRQNRNQFALQTLANRNNFALWLGGQKKVAPRPQLKQPSDPFQPQLPLGKPQPVTPVSERTQKKNSDTANYGDAEVARSVQKIRAKHPAARSDVEALAKDELEHTKRSDQQLAAIKGANTAQDALLRQLVALDKKQGQEIDNLDSENNSQERELERIQATNANLQKTIQSMTGTKQSARPKQSSKTEPQAKTTEPAIVPGSSADPEVEKKLQGLEAQIQQLQNQPQSPDIVQQISKLQNQINSLPAQAAQALNIEPVAQPKQTKQASRVQAPFGDLDIEPPKVKSKTNAKAKTKTTAPKATSVPKPEDEFDLLNIDESANKLHQGDPIVVTAPNEFEGATGEIYEFSPSGSFVIVNLYNHGKHSMHLSDVAYNDYADQEEEDDWYDDNVNDINDGPQHAYDSDGRTRSDQFEGFQDFNKVEPYAVCLAGKPVKKFDYYEQARRFHDNWKQKLYREGNKEKADKITLMPLNLDETINEKGALKAAQDAAKFMLRNLDDRAALKDYSLHFWNPTKFYQGATMAMRGVGFDEIVKHITQDQPAQFEAASPAQQAAIAIAMKKAGKKPKQADEAYTPAPAKPFRNPKGFNKQGTGLGNKLAQLNRKEWEEKKKKEQGVTEDTGSWIVYDPKTKQIRKRFKTHTAGKSYAQTHKLGFASSEYYFDRVKQPVNELDVNTLKSYADKRGAQVAAMQADNPNPQAGSKEWIQQAVPAQQVNLAKRKIARKERQAGVTESAMSNVHAAMADVYHRLAPKIERHRDSFLAGQLYDELENIAELHGIEPEFKRMLAGARNRAHMDYDTNPGGFQNWFWYLPFEGETNEGLMKEPANRKEYLDQRDKLFRMMSMETNPANKQIIKQAIKDLEARYGATNKPVTEESSTSSEAVEIALIRRVLVAHTELIMEFGLDKVTQAIEEVAYNVGDVDEIGTSDVSGWIHQVKQILGVES